MGRSRVDQIAIMIAYVRSESTQEPVDVWRGLPNATKEACRREARAKIQEETKD